MRYFLLLSVSLIKSRKTKDFIIGLKSSVFLLEISVLRRSLIWQNGCIFHLFVEVGKLMLL